MTKRSWLFLMLACLTSPIWAEDLGQTSDINGMINGHVGFKSLDSDDWGDEVNDQLAIGMELDMAKANWPAYVAFGFYHSAGHEDVGPVEVDARTTEIAVGIGKLLDFGRSVGVYFGAGPALMAGSIEEDGPGNDRDDSGVGLGAWASMGFLVKLGERLSTGVQARYSAGDVEIFDVDRNAGGFMGTFFVGGRF